MNVKKKISMISIGILLSFVSIISITESFGMSVYGQNNDDPSDINDSTESKKGKQDVAVDVDLNNLKIEHAGGNFGSLQTDDDNKTWVTSGKWDLQSNPSNATANSSGVIFNATIDMRGTDNSAQHIHKISEFKLAKKSVDSGDEGSVLTFNGTATIETPLGLNGEVPISIKLIDASQVLLSANTQSGIVEPKWIPKGGIISLMIDGQKISDHFGSTPIYGNVRRE
jgi:hypothetical protein